MCARPRRVSDEQIFQAALEAMTCLSPREFTLAAVGERAGITAGALVQRFGSKRNLVLALARAGASDCEDQTAAMLGRHDSPLAALFAYAEGFAGLARTPADYRRNLAYLQEDLADPELSEALHRQARSNRNLIASLLAAAQAAGELDAACRPDRLAGLVEALIAGGMMSWAHHQEGEASACIVALLERLLEPYRAASRRR